MKRSCEGLLQNPAAWGTVPPWACRMLWPLQLGRPRQVCRALPGTWVIALIKPCTVLCYIMLCYAMLCYGMLCYTMLCALCKL